MKEELIRFFTENEVATVCCLTEDNRPHCFNCYYVFIPAVYIMLFKSSPKSLHSKFLTKDAAVAGTVLFSKSDLMKSKGMQFSGKVLQEKANADLANFYYKKYPLAYAKPGELWGIQVEWAKFTNNTLGLGIKQEWFLY